MGDNAIETVATIFPSALELLLFLKNSARISFGIAHTARVAVVVEVEISFSETK